MYEEEEDELPSQYKNLNAHLQTGSSDFDARLQAYLANAVAFRKALSGVAKNRDKSKNVDFVNTRQLADHEALFPKHSDAWKDIILPKTSEAHNSPFVPQGSCAPETKRFDPSPYNAKNSGISNRRMSAGVANTAEVDFMGTLKPSDLKERNVRYRPSGRHPSLPQPSSIERQQSQSPSVQFQNAGINYDSLSLGLDGQSVNAQNTKSDSSPFSSRLPANTLDMLMPYIQADRQSVNTSYEPALDSPFHTQPQNTIDATLLAPSTQKSVRHFNNNEFAPQSHAALWQQSMPRESSANRKLVEDNMWGDFINDPHTEAWDWSNCAQ